MTHPGGRPSKYSPEYCQMIIDHCSNGLSFDSFAGLIGVHIDTIYEWVKVHPEFSEAKKIASCKSLLFWEKMGIDNIMMLTETIRNGRETKTTSKSLNSAVWVFNMKNRFGWKDKKEIVSDDAPKRLIINFNKTKEK